MSGKRPERWIEIPRWNEFQHYADRRPVWIKDYLRQDHDDAYLSLSLAQRGLLHGLRRLYAEWDGIVSESAARRVLVGSESDARYVRVHLEALNHAGLIRILASKPLALETEIEIERTTVRSEQQQTAPAGAETLTVAEELEHDKQHRRRAHRTGTTSDLSSIKLATFADAHPDPEARKRQMRELRAGVPWNERP